jgi:hypothetical protein
MKPWYASKMREALRMARAYTGNRHMRVIWQERAADYRETLIDAIRREAGWTLSERLIGRKL